ncbi:MAG: hypothetical protein FWG93_03515 [Oscillospiraceae bacterium]|nr:hypothetical protein [Oscillospiraceae bacterium]
MKRITLLLAALLLLTACGESTGRPEPPASTTDAPVVPVDPEEYDDYFVYPAIMGSEGSITGFAADENGTVYIAYSVYHDSPGVSAGEQITAYDMNGGVLARYEIPAEVFSVGQICVGDGALYYTASAAGEDGKSQRYIFRLDLQTQAITRLDTPSNLFPWVSSNALPLTSDVNTLYAAIKKLAYLDGKLYILGIQEDYITNEYDDVLGFIEDTGDVFYSFQYDGTVLAAYDIANDAVEIVFGRLLHDFALTPYGTIILQANDPEYDRAEHYANSRTYFAELFLDTMSIGEKIYRDIPSPAGFATDGLGVMFSSMNALMLDSPNGVYYWSLGEDTGITNLGENKRRDILSSDAIAYANGYTFYHRNVNTGREFEHTITRIRNSAYIDLTPPIQIIGANLYGGIPRQGHNIQFSALSHDEFALAVLSGGVAYDLAYVSSRQDFAYNLRKQGSFYPLNDVPGVMEFLEECHPFVREAATDTDGNVWMLPISVEAAGILYHVENSQKAGLDFANAETVDDIISLVRKGAAYNPEGRDYVFNPAILSRNVLIRYLRDNDTLETPEFRRLAPALKEFTRERIQWGRDMPFIILNEAGESIPNDGFLFDNQSVQTSAHVIGRDDLSIAPLTGTGAANPADAVFFCVNSDSRHLEKTLEYISHVCAYLSSQKDAGMLAAPAAYSDSAYARRRRELYAGSVIDFNLSDEVFADDFDRYLRDEISLDTLIREAGRKLAMYRGE